MPPRHGFCSYRSPSLPGYFPGQITRSTSVFDFEIATLSEFFNFFRGDYCVEQVFPQIGEKKRKKEIGRVKKIVTKVWQKTFKFRQ